MDSMHRIMNKFITDSRSAIFIHDTCIGEIDVGFEDLQSYRVECSAHAEFEVSVLKPCVSHHIILRKLS